ncbi:zinc transporter ZIP13-like protein [Dinothrombium tinctorium]|uniref:Zinc transporter ZIP13-like protein n=1 Tax=Dinothrombium tinctorium TaxID=1965070 RepID=A0A3S3SNE8_9ACAR|nr:zinc transporter ZIP13-like protein [Dinothrombium tinctorium]RWS16643.1 zinc transporter ZIP13-like protein [Dinothrombium tinctorium]
MAVNLITEKFSSILNTNDPSYNVWFMSVLASIIVGFTGVVPMFVLPFADIKQNSNTKLKLMLSFAVGGLLGDVFLHLLPEAWSCIHESGSHAHETLLLLGFWVLFGISTFLTIERIAVNISVQESQMKSLHVNGYAQNGTSKMSNGQCVQNGSSFGSKPDNNPVTGYLNLFANSIDNFTHGLAVAASFLVGIKIGILTTFAIIIHEIPHEFGDFAILMKSGFSKWEAVKAQLSTASVGVLGAMVALYAESAENVGKNTAWILPFTAGCFLHVSLVSILPDILKEENPWESLKQLLCIACGIAVMALVNINLNLFTQ